MSAQVASRPALIRTNSGDNVDKFQISSHGSAYNLAGKEAERLNWHHEAMRLCLGGLYPCQELVQEILAPAEGTKKRILDLGCGSRIWCCEMAKEFPEAEILGVDRPHVKAIWEGEVPANCRFQTHSTYNFLNRHQGKFDLIHMRFVAGGCDQFLKTLDDIQASLKPGGLFILIDSTGDVLAEDGVSVLRMRSKRHPEGSRLRRMFFEVHHANCNLGFDENMMFGVLEDGLWEFTEMEDCRAAELSVPIGPWGRSEAIEEEEKRLTDAGRLMQQSLRTVQAGHEFVLKSAKFDESVLRRWRREIEAELGNDNSKTSLDIRVLWGRRASDSPLSNPNEPVNEDEVSTPTASSFVPDPSHWRVYDTAEKWKQMLDRRGLLGGGAPEPIMPFVEKKKKRQVRRANP